MTSHPGTGLADQFLKEPNLERRVEIARTVVNGREPNDAVNVLFAALNSAVDQLRAVLEVIALDPTIDSNHVLAQMQIRLEHRSGEYLTHQFNNIVQGIDTP